MCDGVIEHGEVECFATVFAGEGLTPETYIFYLNRVRLSRAESACTTDVKILLLQRNQSSNIPT